MYNFHRGVFKVHFKNAGAENSLERRDTKHQAYNISAAFSDVDERIPRVARLKRNLKRDTFRTTCRSALRCAVNLGMTHSIVVEILLKQIYRLLAPLRRTV